MDLEIRVHGRGGQGGVTCAKLLAAIYSGLGRSVQSFGDYAGERSGAPIRAYTRVSDGAISNRNKVYDPDHLVVLDPTLLGAEVVSGLRHGGLLLLNTTEPVEAFADRFREYRLAVVDATAIAREHGIGTRSVVIVNTTIAGVFVRAMDLPFTALEQAYAHMGLLSNLAAARAGYDSVVVREAETVAAAAPPPAVVEAAERPRIESLPEHVSSPPPTLRTGSWRTQRPNYKESLAPCNAFCPAGNDVVGFIQALAKDGLEEAARILRRTQPLAAVCGRVCPAPCMEGCNRREYDGSVNIRGLERWIGDNGELFPFEIERSATPRRVAIVGGGPAGLAAAHTVALAGHDATLFEREARLGGVLFTGIPPYRLPPEVVEREVDGILGLGVTAHCGEPIDSDRIAELEREYDAVILSTGLQRLRGFDDPGGFRAGIEQGIHFLQRVNMGDVSRVEGRVVVLGGGNTAVDCARSALRLGAESVTIAYRRSRQEMPAIAEEIEEAIEEGVRLELLRQPVGFHGIDTIVEVELVEVELGELDDSGRRRPIITDRRGRLPCDRVLLALGQSADLTLLPDGAEIRGARVWVGDTATNVFVSGDVATGDGTVTHAIGSGRWAAGVALAALGEDLVPFQRPDRTDAVPLSDIRVDHFERRPAALDRRSAQPSHTKGFDEVSLGLADAAEAHRCFSCGHCTGCDTCLVYCPEGIIRRRELDYEVDYSYCKGCGICVTECPRQAMEMVPEWRAN